MGRRRKQKVQKRQQKVIPKIFDCPECGKSTITVEIKKMEKVAFIKCGNCKLEGKVNANYLSEPVDIYGDFIDKYYKSYAKSE